MEKKNPALLEQRGLPIDRKQAYLRALLEAFSGLILALAEVVVELT
jgi:hypothetical protein